MPTKAVQQFMLGTVLGNETQTRETLAAMKAAGDDAQVLALSTCSTEFTDARTILLAWMIPSASDS